MYLRYLIQENVGNATASTLVHVTQRFSDFVVQGVANVRHSTLVCEPDSFFDFVQQGIVNVQVVQVLPYDVFLLPVLENYG